MYKQDPKIPNGSMWQHKRFFFRYEIVGFSEICNRYMLVHVFPQYIMDQMPKEEHSGNPKTSMIAPEYLRTQMRRVK